MKLIIKDYLASLKERGELDAVLPDLLSEIGLNVYSRPARGTRQDGVDVAAVGSIDGGPEKVYLFSIKPGNLSRSDWVSDSPQSLRASLIDIVDSYVPNRLPVEHRDKDIVICITIGGDVQEQARTLITGYTDQNTKGKISFEEWNGDKLADLIQSSFLQEELLPANGRAHLRKALALLDEPDAAYKHFAALVQSLSTTDSQTDTQRTTAIRQLSICYWILFAWARDAGNVEAAYRAGELALLHGWNIVKQYPDSGKKAARDIEAAFFSIFSAYQQTCNEFLGTNVFLHVEKLHGVSVAIRGSCSLDINLKLFDLLGRLAIDGLWDYWGVVKCKEDEKELRELRLQGVQKCANAIRSLIDNNPALLSPTKDDHIIDISFAVSLLLVDAQNHDFIRNWLGAVVARSRFAYVANGRYPCVLQAYSDLLTHPKRGDQEYRENTTSASVLYPMIALFAALLEDKDAYEGVMAFKKENLGHCTFQFWYPDDRSEVHFYLNADAHGAAFSDFSIEQPYSSFLDRVFSECDQTPHFKELSAVKFGWWPIVLIACRHYRLPMPLQLLKGFKSNLPESVSSDDPDSYDVQT